MLIFSCKIKQKDNDVSHVTKEHLSMLTSYLGKYFALKWRVLNYEMHADDNINQERKYCLQHTTDLSSKNNLHQYLRGLKPKTAEPDICFSMKTNS